MLGFFRRRIIFQQQGAIGGFGRAGNAGAAGAAGATGPAGAAGNSGLGPTDTDNLSSAQITGAFGAPIALIPAAAGITYVPLMMWSEMNCTVAASNSPQYQTGWTGVSGNNNQISYSSGMTTTRNAGNRGVPNPATMNSPIGTKLPSVGLALSLALSAAPTGGPPTVTGTTLVLYFPINALITA